MSYVWRRGPDEDWNEIYDMEIEQLKKRIVSIEQRKTPKA